MSETCSWSEFSGLTIVSQLFQDIILPDVYTRDIEGWQYCNGIVDCELSGSDEEDCKESDCRDYDCVR